MSPTTLTLHVLSRDGETPAAALVHAFDARGGTIGRGAQADWALPDPERVLSSHHATVYWEAGQYHLVDCSSNGVYVNDDEEPLGQHRTATLQQGDRLTMGPYQLRVALDDAAPAQPAGDPAVPATPAEAPPETAPLPDGWGGISRPSSAAVSAAQVDPLALLAPPPAPVVDPPLLRDDTPVLAQAFAPPPLSAPFSSALFSSAPLSSSPLPADWLDEPTPPAAVAVPAPAEVAAALQALAEARAAVQRAEHLLCALSRMHPEVDHGLA